MTAEEALALLDTLLQKQKLKDIQESVFRYAWQGLTYPEIAQYLGYDASYVRDVGYQLWQQLTQEFGEQVTKKNLQEVIMRQFYLSQKGNARSPLSSESTPIETIAIASEEALTHKEIDAANSTVSDRIDPALRRSLDTTSSQYWGERIDVTSFYGRSTEIAQLQQWIVGSGTHPEKNRCRLVSVLGMGGIGKTTLVAKLTEQIQDEFDFLIWQSLRNAPPIAEVLTTSIQHLSRQQTTVISQAVEAQISQLMDYLRSHRCLLIFDNFDAVLSSTSDGSRPYREGCEGYNELLREVSSKFHSSCLVLTSRVKPRILFPFEGDKLPARSLLLAGLGKTEILEIFKVDGCFSQTEADWEHLTETYAGNPLALKIVSTTVRDIFDGSISEFLTQGAIAFGDINLLLGQQFHRLSNLEKQVMYWLAIDREWVALAELREDFFPSPPQHTLLEALLSLAQRSLIEKSVGSFTLQPVVMEYVTEQLLGHICEELETQELDLFISHALILAQAKDYIRESQIRVILAPLAQRLVDKWRLKQEVEYRLKSILDKLRLTASHELRESHSLVGYAGGNILNLLNQLQLDLSGSDFSHLSIWQAYLVDTDLHRVNFAHANFSKSVFKQTFSGVFTVAFSSDGRSLVAGDSLGQVLLWRVPNGQPLWQAIGHTQWVRSVDFSPDGASVVSSSLDGSIKLWDTRTGQLLQTLPGHSPLRVVTFSPDGTTIASGGLDRAIRIWDAKTGQLLQAWQGHTNTVKSLAFSPDGTKLASGSFDRTIKIWDVSTGQLLKTLPGHDGIILSVDWHPDGATIASCGGDRVIKLWNAFTGKLVKILEGHTHWICCLQFSTDGRILISGSDDRTIKLWDVPTGKLLRNLPGHRYWVMAVALNADSTIAASGSEDQTVKFWEVSTGKLLNTLQGHSNSVLSVAWSIDGQVLASGSADFTVSLWDANIGEHVKRLSRHTHGVWSIAFSPDGRFLASGSDDSTIKLWEANAGSLIRTFEGHTHWALSIDFSPDGTKLVAGSMDQGVWLWEVNNEQAFQRWQGHTNLVWSVNFSSNGQVLASGGDDYTAKLWDVQSGQVIQTFVHPNSVLSVKFSVDQTALITGGADCLIRIWDLSTGQIARTLSDHTDRILAIALNREGTLIASSSADRTVKLWDINTGELLQTLQGHNYWVHSVAFSPNGDRLASGSGDGTIRLWDVETGGCLTTLRTPRPYEGTNIAGAIGLTEAQKMTLKALGAIELESVANFVG
ncbi:NB-ARC domain-containing protein [Pseudanabaena sp. PCC 6802]|uniref:WD40 domain-containing protein n=1 Tax=Pseudanabaena sp. PCC 6802 TaxID=118173 RepID=UPI00034DAB50|nr:NB-ARC domain-containing protein [Pseudanabaena sp. PCC 6802]